MGGVFSSNQLSGGVTNGAPTISYAYGPSNAFFLGADATYSYDGPTFLSLNPQGEITPFLVQPNLAAPTLTCTPITIYATDQSLSCPIAGTSLSPGQYTLSFSQYTSTAYSTDDAGTVYYTKSDDTDPGDAPNTLTAYEDGYTISIVAPIAAAITTSTITPTLTAYTTVTSGVSEIGPTSTGTIPSSIATVTVFSTTIMKYSTKKSTLSGISTIITKTATCSMMKCNQDNCIRAMSNKAASASSFCSIYTTTKSLATPTYLSQCSGLASRVSSACSCFATPTSREVLAPRGIEAILYGPPDLTYIGDIPAMTVTETDPAPSTVTSTFPSGTTTDPNPTVTTGTLTRTSTLKLTTTTIIVSSVVDKRSSSVTTVQPTTCH